MKKKIVSMLLAGMMLGNTGLVAFAREAEPIDSATETVVAEAATTEAVAAETKASEEVAEDTAESTTEATKVAEAEDTSASDEVASEETVADTESEDVEVTEADSTTEKESAELYSEEEVEEKDEDIGKIIGFRSLGVITFDYEPTVDDIKAALPGRVVAILKGEHENIEADMSITFNDAAIENIISQLSDTNVADTELTFTLEAQVLTSCDYVENVATPTVTIKLVDEGYDLTYQTLSDEASGVTVEGMLPEGAKVEVVSNEETLVDAAVEDMALAEENVDLDDKTVDRKYVVNNYNITVYDNEGREYVPEQALLVTEKLDEEEVAAIAGNQYTLYDDKGDIIEHSFDANLGEITYLANDFSSDITTLGTKTDFMYTVSFEIRDSATDQVLFATEGRFPKGTEIITPEFYGKDYDLASINWGDIDELVTRDATYIAYINKTIVEVETGQEDADLEVASYGEKLLVEDTTAINEEKNVSVEAEETVATQNNPSDTNEVTVDVTEELIDKSKTDDIILSDKTVVTVAPDDVSTDTTELEAEAPTDTSVEDAVTSENVGIPTEVTEVDTEIEASEPIQTTE